MQKPTSSHASSAYVEEQRLLAGRGVECDGLHLEDYVQAWDGSKYTAAYLSALVGIRSTPGHVQTGLPAMWWFMDDSSESRLFGARWRPYAAEESGLIEEAFTSGASSIVLASGRTVHLRVPVQLGDSFNPIMPGSMHLPFVPPTLSTDERPKARDPAARGDEPSSPALVSFHLEQRPPALGCARAAGNRRVARVLHEHRTAWERANLWIADQLQDQARAGFTVKVGAGQVEVLSGIPLPRCVSPSFCSWSVVGKPASSYGRWLPTSARVAGSDALDIKLGVRDFGIAYVLKDEPNLGARNLADAGFLLGDESTAALKVGVVDRIPDALETDSLQMRFSGRLALGTAQGMALAVSNGCVPGVRASVQGLDQQIGLHVTLTGQLKLTLQLEVNWDELGRSLALTHLGFANPYLHVASLGCLGWLRPPINRMLPRKLVASKARGLAASGLNQLVEELLSRLFCPDEQRAPSGGLMPNPEWSARIHEALLGMLDQLKGAIPPDFDIRSMRVIWPEGPHDLQTAMTVQDLIDGVAAEGTMASAKALVEPLLAGKVLTLDVIGPVGGQDILTGAAETQKMNAVGQVGPFTGWAHTAAVNACFRLLTGGIDASGRRVPGPLRDLLGSFVEPLIESPTLAYDYPYLDFLGLEREALKKMTVELLSESWAAAIRKKTWELSWALGIALKAAGVLSDLQALETTLHGLVAHPGFTSLHLGGVAKGVDLVDRVQVRTSLAYTSFVEAARLKAFLVAANMPIDKIPVTDDAVLTTLNVHATISLNQTARLHLGNVDGIFTDFDADRAAVNESVASIMVRMSVVFLALSSIVVPLAPILLPVFAVAVIALVALQEVFDINDPPSLRLGGLQVEVSDAQLLVVSSANSTAFTSLYGRLGKAPGAESISVKVTNLSSAIDAFVCGALGDGKLADAMKAIISTLSRKTVGELAQENINNALKQKLNAASERATFDVDMAAMLVQASGFDISEFVHVQGSATAVAPNTNEPGPPVPGPLAPNQPKRVGSGERRGPRRSFSLRNCWARRDRSTKRTADGRTEDEDRDCD